MTYQQWRDQEMSDFRDKLRGWGFILPAADNLVHIVSGLMDEAKDYENVVHEDRPPSTE